jgi:hypothetical protein
MQMATIDRDLVKAINSGRCFALVGAGPSCEIGLPDWRKLTEIIVSKIDPSNKCPERTADITNLIANGHYPRVFSIAQDILGKEQLLQHVKDALSSPSGHGNIYHHLSIWPFPCYLSTNFDDCLSTSLSADGFSFTTKRNTYHDMLLLRADAKNIIFKIHGDFSVPDDIVLTEEQYLAFQSAPARKYWQEKIRAVLHMVDILIMGYSANDPDFADQLKLAKEFAAPDKPVFMFAANVKPTQIQEYYSMYNIRIISYKNLDGTHRELTKFLKRYDPFIAKRGSASVGLEPVDEDMASLASSIYLFTHLRLAGNDSCIRKTYASVILQILSQVTVPEGLDISQLQTSLTKKTYAIGDVDPIAMNNALALLHDQGLITLTSGNMIYLTSRGNEILATIRAERTLIKEQFEICCQTFLKREYPNLDNVALSLVIKSLDIGLTHAYRQRGMEFAKSVFREDIFDASNATDLLETINRANSTLHNEELRVAFADLMIEVMLRPCKEMKDYLAALAQGYFAYHALGLDPKCSQERLDAAKGRKWILDSSILLPMLATDCINNHYAEDLFNRMKDLGFNFCTTEKLLAETQEHARYVVRNFQNVPHDSPTFIQAAISGPGYKQNLFLDGFLKRSQTQGIPSLNDYMRECLGPNYEANLHESIQTRILEKGIDVIKFDEIEGFTQELWDERDTITENIKDLRIQSGTFRKDSQCTAEAEVVLICEREKAAFLSQSDTLKRLGRTNRNKITFRPEAMYRLLSMFSCTPPNADLLYDCMIQDFYYAGFDIVNREVVSQYVAPLVHQARMNLEQEKQRYEEVLGQQKYDEIRQNFEKTPDEQKPFYSFQFAFYVANAEIKKRLAAEAKARSSEDLKRLNGKERAEYERLKAKEAERKQKAKKRQRKAQSRKKKR